MVDEAIRNADRVENQNASEVLKLKRSRVSTTKGSRRLTAGGLVGL
jgi:hypothetical protein